MSELFSTPFFGIALCFLCYGAGLFIQKKTRLSVANPMMLAVIFCILILKLFNIPLEDFQKGGNVISLFLAPATVSLAVSIYRQLPILKRNLFPVLAGCTFGSLASMGSIYTLCRLFRLDEQISSSLLPKSVTAPIAIAVSETLGGIPSITVAAVVVTGIAGAIAAPALIRLFCIKDPAEAGTAIGTCSHVLGTSRAIEIGETEGAMSGIAIGVSGIVTVLFAAVIS